MAPPDFRFQPSLNITGMAELLSQKPVKEEQIRLAQQAERRQRMNSLMEAVQLGSNLATQGIARSQARQEMQARRGFAEAIEEYGRAQQLPNRSVTRTVPAEGPVTAEGVSPVAFERTTMGETPQGQEIARNRMDQAKSNIFSAFSRVAPKESGLSMIEMLNRDPELANLDKKEKESVIFKNFMQGQKAVKDSSSAPTLAEQEAAVVAQYVKSGIKSLSKEQKKLLGKALGSDPFLNNAIRLQTANPLSNMGKTNGQILKETIGIGKILRMTFGDEGPGEMDDFNTNLEDAIKKIKDKKTSVEAVKEAFREAYSDPKYAPLLNKALDKLDRLK